MEAGRPKREKEEKMPKIWYFRHYFLLLQVNCNKVMSSREYLGRYSPNLFWDADPSEISMDDSSDYIIQHVLEHGQMNDWRLINQYYGLDKIVEECKRMRTLDPVCLSFITTITYKRGRLQMISFQTVLPDTLELLRTLTMQPLL